MKYLQTIQKTFKVFQILTKIAEIFCIVGASLSAVLALCDVIWLSGGRVISIMGEPIENFIKGDLMQAYVTLLSFTFMLTANAILLGFAHSYLKSEQADGTPFTENGAKRLNKLGIRCIYIPIIAIAVTNAFVAWFEAESTVDIGNLPSLVTGIILILASLIFRYGAELEKGTQSASTDKA